MVVIFLIRNNFSKSLIGTLCIILISLFSLFSCSEKNEALDEPQAKNVEAQKQKDEPKRLEHGKPIVVDENDFPKRYIINVGIKKGAIDREGNIVINPDFWILKPFREGLAKAGNRPASGVGFVNTVGEWVIEPIYSGATDFREGLSVVNKTLHGKRGYINRNGEIVIDFKYEGAASFSEGLASVSIEDKDGDRIDCLIDQKGEIVFPCRKDGLKYTNFVEGISILYSERPNASSYPTCWYIDEEGNILFDGKSFDWAEPFHEGIAVVYDRVEGFYFIDSEGNQVYKGSGGKKLRFSEGVAPFLDLDWKWGYINIGGEIVIEPQFLEAKSFTEGLALVNVGTKVLRQGGHGEAKIGYIDKNVKMVIPPALSYGEPFKDGLARVSYKQMDMYIDKELNVVYAGPVTDEQFETYRVELEVEGFNFNDTNRPFISDEQRKTFWRETGEPVGR